MKLEKQAPAHHILRGPVGLGPVPEMTEFLGEKVPALCPIGCKECAYIFKVPPGVRCSPIANLCLYDALHILDGILNERILRSITEGLPYPAFFFLTKYRIMFYIE
jgi:hypothetical protein